MKDITKNNKKQNNGFGVGGHTWVEIPTRVSISCIALEKLLYLLIFFIICKRNVIMPNRVIVKLNQDHVCQDL